MKHLNRTLVFLLLLCTTTFSIQAESWRDKTELLIYTPRYFGPNAFPIPTLRSGKVSERFEAEVRGEYHHYSGDKTKDLFARVLLPFVRGKAGVELSLVITEKYKMTPETRDERFAVETESPIPCHGDLVFNAFFQVLESKKWADVMISANIKTASGGRLCDARYTDAASYWFDVTVGRDLFQSADSHWKLRAQAMAGFYCWMTNDLIHRQNDAPLYGGGLTANYRNFELQTDLSGFHGYKKNGDQPLVLRNRLTYEFKKNIISFRYNHGINDWLYDSFSLGYIRCF